MSVGNQRLDKKSVIKKLNVLYNPVGIEDLKLVVNFFIGIVDESLLCTHYMHTRVQALPPKVLIGYGRPILPDIPRNFFRVLL